ncbi:hypothetical protein T484DRAFT_1776820 [Baffinella frigidus]|nr:hypothetical protein T484DRAFT_1776820 [Cryptophyta sp. CCMP2293]
MLSHEEEKIRKMAGDSMAALLKLNPSAAQETVKQLKDLYVEAKTEFGAFTRSGCALALHSVAEYLSKKEIVVLFPFLVSDKEQGLSDPDELVRSQMTKAALRLIELHGTP